MIKQNTNGSPDARRDAILKEVAVRGECGVDDLAEQFGVSTMTIRRDLQALADAGRVVRTHGGAAPASRVSFEFRFLERARQLRGEKNAIADKAVEHVQDGMSIMLDSGTTTVAIARKLRRGRNLTVITTSLPIASELYGFDNVRLLLLGGFLQHDSPDLSGALTESNLESLHADIAFVGADGVDEKGNVYNRQSSLGRMIGKMAESSQRVYVVADHTKLGGRALVRFGNLKDYTALITDTGGKAFARKLKRQGINVEIA